MTRAVLVLCVLSLTACSTESTPAPAVTDSAVTDSAVTDSAVTDSPAERATAVMNFSSAEFWSAPFPSEHRRTSDGTIALSGLPNPGNVGFIRQLISLGAGDSAGFGLSSAVYFPLTAPLDPTGLPDFHSSLSAGASVGLISVDPGSVDYLQRYPVSAHFDPDGGPYGAPNLVSLLPLQGAPLRPNTLYAAYLRTTLRDPHGRPLQPSDTFGLLQANVPIAGLSPSATMAYRSALGSLTHAGVDVSTLAALAVFRTGDPTAGLRAARTQVLSSPLPVLTAPFAPAEVFDTFCVYRSTIRMPVFQSGTPPFSSEGGTWARDGDNHLVLQRQEESAVWVTIPRRVMPTEGYPLTVFVRTGGGGDRPLIDRGVQPSTGIASPPGTGPAVQLSLAGVAGLSVDGPHGGLRNITHGDEQFLVFNFNNLGALRDNIRQSALELSLMAHIVSELRLDASACPGANVSNAHFDTRTLSLMGHSTGATIGSIAVAIEPMYRAAVLSGAGGSFVMNLVYKLRPLAVRPLAETFLRYTGIGRHLDEYDIAANLAQWVGEPADPPVYARLVTREPAMGTAPRHVLMFQGIVDHYIMPPIANALSLALGVAPAGPELDRTEPRLAGFTPVRALIDLVGSRTTPLPAHANRDGITAVLVQQPEDGHEDGHETVFQTDAPRRQYRCFFESLQHGPPTVPANGALAAPCDE